MSPKEIYVWLITPKTGCSTPTVIREMQNEVTMRHCFSDKHWWGHGDIGTLPCCWWECRDGAAALENSLVVLGKGERRFIT